MESAPSLVKVMTIRAQRIGTDSGEASMHRAPARNFGTSPQTFPTELKVGVRNVRMQSNTRPAGRESTMMLPVRASLEPG